MEILGSRVKETVSKKEFDNKIKIKLKKAINCKDDEKNLNRC